MLEELLCECGNNIFKISVSGRYLLCNKCKVLWRLEDLQDRYIAEQEKTLNNGE